VLPGDEVVVDNRRYLAYCYRYRHTVNPGDPAQSHLMLDGVPLYPQRPAPVSMMAPAFGVAEFKGRYRGKVLTVQHSHDSSIWPRPHSFPGGEDRWVLRWTENAEHVPSSVLPPSVGPSPLSRLIDWKGNIDQSLHDLVAWVEQGVVPIGTHGATIKPGGQLMLPNDAKERGGIQPVVRATANRTARAEIPVGGRVTLSVETEVPPGAGTIVEVAWDFDGTGTYPYRDDSIDGTQSKLTSSVTHTFDTAGTFFPSAKVTSHRDGEVGATTRRVENLARVRVVVG
jgi:hypothetical protein